MLATPGYIPINSAHGVLFPPNPYQRLFLVLLITVILRDVSFYLHFPDGW